ncbi:restriction endonuclease subunit R [Scytonema sp. NUACC26]|uniref:restriction endonuclease subunit R n=1 Tax=Scytonema sp. NUACC26 TaxID=3140176 RepID=UPI0034DC7B8B
MLQTIQAKEISLIELETIFQLQRVEEPQFFYEWQRDLPELSEWQRQLLDRIKAGYFNLLKKPPLLEKPINLAVISPLLFTGQFYLSPFDLRAEKNVEISVEDEEKSIITKGNLDTLVLKDKLWVMVIESKQAKLSVEAGLAQILAYILDRTNPNNSCFGMITNGGSFLFVKLLKGEIPQYGTSDLFGINNQKNNLYDVLKILKHLIELAITQA